MHVCTEADLSSILKALKKLEDESPASVPISESGHYAPRQVFKKNHKAGKNSLFRILASISAVGILAAVAGLIMALSNESSDRHDSESTTIEKRLEAESKPRLDNTLAVLSPSPKNETQKVDVPEGGTGVIVRPKINLKPPPKPPGSASRKPVASAAATGGKAGRGAARTNHSSAKAPVTADDRVTAGAAPVKAHTDELPNTAEAERLDLGLPNPDITSGHNDSPEAGYRKSLDIPESSDSYGLKLQAIAWADSPEQRMAVVNGSVVREGGSIDDVQISRIEPDSVVIHGSEGTFRLIYGLQ